MHPTAVRYAVRENDKHTVEINSELLTGILLFSKVSKARGVGVREFVVVRGFRTKWTSNVRC